MDIPLVSPMTNPFEEFEAGHENFDIVLFLDLVNFQSPRIEDTAIVLFAFRFETKDFQGKKDLN